MANDPRPERGSTRLAVLGSPISHSKSPLLHGAAYRELGLDWEYTAIEVDEQGLARFLDTRDASWRGLSLTFPLKHEVLGLVDELDRVAQLAAAANTVRFDDGRRLGFNTDVGGIVNSLREQGVGAVERAAIVGAGATAASALIAIAGLGGRAVDVYLRTPGKAAALVALGERLGVAVAARPITALSDASGPTQLVVATLPGGTDPGVAVSEALRRGAFLLDVVYGHWPTPIATQWLESGGRVADGLGMLLHQALLQVRVFANGSPDAPLDREAEVLAAMRAALD
ncbi:shikimate dehydrogenase [Agromyces intestinalis]|uniref:Shikimate dehydrogenase n=1 Tax=Agromyces intestinalis TaxID=2592652 RepID=A0A5C1YIS6_9MICO|nr:shikimate dehydrogenase [Agromyces intestinalis]QEO15871.1 shikimate dehydrogenase [Agromyces intestinalis]